MYSIKIAKSSKLTVTLLALSLSACATTSPPLPPAVVSGPQLTPLPAEVLQIEPVPLGTYWAKQRALQVNIQKQLNAMPAK